MIKSAAEARVAALLEQVEPITVEQYAAMVAHGILHEGAPIELIEGLLVRKDRAKAGEDPMTVGPRHHLAIKKIARLGGRVEKLGHHLSIQGPVRLPPHSEPEPDGAFVKGVAEDYVDRHPGPPELPCLIEVADSSLRFDRTMKLGVYAAAGIAQYVIVNLIDDRVEVHTDPSPDERCYRTTRIFTGEQALTLAVGKGSLKLKAKDLIP